MSEPNPFDSPHPKPLPSDDRKWWWGLSPVEVVVVVFIILILLGLLLPAVNMGYCRPYSEAMHKLLTIGDALNAYHDEHGTLPPAVVTDADGKPLYSWRVLILPQLDQKNLYKQFNLDEPWDSETNRPLAQFMPYEYESRWVDPEAEPGTTACLAVVDSDATRTLMRPQEGQSLDDFPNVRGKAPLVVHDHHYATIWTKPGDVSPFMLIRGAPINQNELPVYPLLLGSGSGVLVSKEDQDELRKYFALDVVAEQNAASE